MRAIMKSRLKQYLSRIIVAVLIPSLMTDPIRSITMQVMNSSRARSVSIQFQTETFAPRFGQEALAAPFLSALTTAFLKTKSWINRRLSGKPPAAPTESPADFEQYLARMPADYIVANVKDPVLQESLNKTPSGLERYRLLRKAGYSDEDIRLLVIDGGKSTMINTPKKEIEDGNATENLNGGANLSGRTTSAAWKELTESYEAALKTSLELLKASGLGTLAQQAVCVAEEVLRTSVEGEVIPLGELAFSPADLALDMKPYINFVQLLFPETMELFELKGKQWRYPHTFPVPLFNPLGVFLPLPSIWVDGSKLSSQELATLGIQPADQDGDKHASLPMWRSYLNMAEAVASGRVVYFPRNSILICLKTAKGLRILNDLAEKERIFIEHHSNDELEQFKASIWGKHASFPEVHWNTAISAKLVQEGLVTRLPFLSLRYKGVGANYIGRFSQDAATNGVSEEVLKKVPAAGKAASFVGNRRRLGEKGIFLDEGYQAHSKVPIGAAAPADELAVERDREFLARGAAMSVLNLDSVALLTQDQIPQLTIPKITVVIGVVLDTTRTLAEIGWIPNFYKSWVRNTYRTDFAAARIHHLEEVSTHIGGNLRIALDLGLTLSEHSTNAAKDLSAFGRLKDTGDMLPISEENSETNIVRLWLEALLDVVTCSGVTPREYLASRACLELVRAFIHDDEPDEKGESSKIQRFFIKMATEIPDRIERTAIHLMLGKFLLQWWDTDKKMMNAISDFMDQFKVIDIRNGLDAAA
jgi:hypothetical protein